LFQSKISLITEDQVRQVLHYERLIPAIEQALIDFSAGKVQQPVRTVMRVPEHNAWFAAMPAVYNDVMGAKLVSFYPHNAERGIPTHLAMILLLRASTGEPLAAMDARLITEMRTAAVSAVATRRLAPEGANILAILGSGVQARSHIEALRRVRHFEQVRVWSPTQDHAQRLANEVGAVAMLSAESAVRNAGVIVTVTNADEPVLYGSWIEPDAYVNAAGAVGPGRRELDDEAMRGTVIVESRESASQESGDIILSHSTIHAELGELLADKTAKLPPGRIIFKSLGIAVEDLTAARLVYEEVTGVPLTVDG
jgi:ornithine cyclodeaminase/alanine dehydrogenase-like protein (mu-crystallin family)